MAPDIWYLALAQDPDAVDRWSRLLSPDERARAARFHDAQRRHQAVASRALLRMALKARFGGAPHSWTIAAEASGRPCLAGTRASVGVSITHTAGLVAVAVADDPRIGVDAEALARAGEIAEVADNILSPNEARALTGLDAKAAARHLVTLWTLKEAWSKATGDGLAADFRDMSFDVPALRDGQGVAGDWRFASIETPSGHILSVVTDRTGVALPRARDARALMAAPAT